jgi:hypothetical protein
LATVPAAQHTAPAELPAQSSGPSHAHVSEPVIGHAAPPAWQLDWSTDVLGASQHSSPGAQWIEPVGVNGQ